MTHSHKLHIKLNEMLKGSRRAFKLHLCCISIWLTFKSRTCWRGIKNLSIVVISASETRNSFEVTQAINFFFLFKHLIDILTSTHRTRYECIMKMQMSWINVWQFNLFFWNITDFNSTFKKKNALALISRQRGTTFSARSLSNLSQSQTRCAVCNFGFRL